MNNSRKVNVIVLLLVTSSFIIKVNSQELVIKTNMPYLLTTTFNIGTEYLFSEKLSIELTAGFNPFNFNDDKRIKHIVIWPEIRYWTYESFNGHFLGLHGVGGIFNISGWDLGVDMLNTLKNNRYQGRAVGAGISYGYQWIVSSKLALEVTAGLGLVNINYDSYSLSGGGHQVGQGDKNYFGPTKGAFSLIYLIK